MESVWQGAFWIAAERCFSHKLIGNEDKMRYTGKRIVAAALASAICIIGLVACSIGEGTKIVFTTGFGKNEVFRIEDESCTKAEIMVYLTNTQNQYENVYGSRIWEISRDGVTLEENVKETVLAKIAQIKSMYLLALEKGVALDEAEEQGVLQAAAEYFGSLNETETEAMGADLETIEKLYREYAMAQKVYQEIIRDINPEISDDEARTITVQHILIRTSATDAEGNRIPYTEEERTAAYDTISRIHAMAVEEGQDFAELASRYSEDSNITYSFGKGEMDQAFETAAFSLETNEISGIVESGSGYHIIKCLSTFDREETDANKLEIVEQRRKEAFGQEYDEFADTLIKNLNEKLWDEITLIHDSNVTTSDFFDIYEKYFPEAS